MRKDLGKLKCLVYRRLTHENENKRKFKKIRSKIKYKKEIVMVAQSETMVAYVVQLYDILKGDDRLKIYFVFPDKSQIFKEIYSLLKIIPLLN